MALPNTTNFDSKKNTLFWVLGSIILANALLAEIIGVKIFSAEAIFKLPGAQLPVLADFKLDFNLTVGAIIWPVVFISTDIVNEYFGKAGVKKISLLTVLLILYMFGVLLVVSALPPAPFWLDVNSQDAAGRGFNINEAFNRIFRQSFGIIIGSVTAFLMAQFLDAAVFHRLRQLTGHRKIWLRATGSTLVSQLVDSVVVLFVAFYLFGNWPLQQVWAVAGINYLYKFTVAILLTPLLYLAHFAIDRYLGPSLAEQLQQAAGK